ncbi:anti-sigma-K factor rskA [Diaminobutyricimonas aerilata]|uniref:Regulator of SigK n=1 Tax=Diaminobutyricimonas aerilata TaxID=1162967 RepID=A0A2M9CME5_9MICO|nr:anti-sigma factor [Diaminobutyricimonas aerilata]PJJ73070.1 anti-sigma-K factor rskA [Diaminobutyricimonas aerilata]
MTRHDDENSTGAYVLNALSESERAEFEARVSESGSLPHEVTELADTAVVLGLAVEPVTPSPDLKARLMAAVATTPQLPRETPAGPTAVSPAEVAPATVTRAASVPPVATVDPRIERAATPDAGPAERRARRSWVRTSVAVLGAVAAAAGLLFGGVAIGRSLDRPPAVSTEAAAFAEVAAAPDARRVVQQLPTGATLSMYYSLELQRSAISWDGLDELPEGEVYELWYIGDETVSAGLFRAGSGDNFAVLDGEMNAGDAVGITIEPEGGSKEPTLERLVTVLET